MADDLARIDKEILRLRDRYHDLVATVSGLALEVDELNAWRERDERRIAALSLAAEVADEVREALNERRSSEWSRWQKAAAAAAGIATLAGGVTSTLNAIGWL